MDRILSLCILFILSIGQAVTFVNLKRFIAGSFFIVFIAGIIGMFAWSGNAFAAARTATQNGNWNSTSTWGGNPVPVADDTVTVNDGILVTVTADAECSSITILKCNSSSGGGIQINDTHTLTVSGAIIIRQNDAGDNGIRVGGGVLNAASIEIEEGDASADYSEVSVSTGTINVTGDFTFTTASGSNGTARLTFIGAGGTLNIGGTLDSQGTFATAQGTINFNGAAQTVPGLNCNYYHLTLSGSGTKTMSSSITTIGGNFTLSGTASTTTAANLSVAGNLDIGNGVSLTVGAYTLSVGGTTTVGGGSSGTLTFSSATNPSKTFTGLVTINSGASWTENAAITPAFRGGITNSGTFTASSGVHTFNTNNQALRGTLSIPSVTVTGITLTNNDTLTVETALSGTGGLTQAVNATLNISGTSGITTLTATNSGNTVDYNGASQTVHANNYCHLILSGSGTKTRQAGTTSISGNFTMSGTASSSAAAGLTIGGSVTLGNGTTFDIKDYVHNVAGNWTNNGCTFTCGTTNSIINMNGSGEAVIGGTSPTTFYNLTVNKDASSTTVTSSSKAFTVNNDLTVTRGNLILEAIDENYVVTNDLIVDANGTLTHSVHWDTVSKLLRVNGNVSIDGVYTYTVRSHLQMGGTNKTIRTGAFPSGLCILTLVHTSGSITAGGTVTVKDNFWASFNTAGGTFATSTYTVNANASLLNAGGTVNINGGALNVTGGFLSGTSSSNGNVTFSSGTLTTDSLVIGDGTRTGTFSQSGGTANIGDLTLSGAGNSYTCTNSPAINVRGNWTNNGGTFTPASSTVTLDGGTSQALGGSSSTTFNNLTVNNLAGVTLDAPETVGGTLTFASGNIATGANTLVISSGATGAMVHTSGHVVGNLQRAIAAGANTYRFDVGTSFSYAPVNVAYTGATAGSLTARVTSGQHPDASSPVNTAKDVNLYWTLSNGTTCTSYAPTFTYNAGDIIGAAPQDSFIAAQYTSSAWTKPTPVTNAGSGPYTTSVSGLTTYGDFVIGEWAAPVLTIVKSAVPDKSVTPGQVITCSTLIANTEAGKATSVVVTDTLSRYVQWRLDSYGEGFAFLFTDGTPASGLTLGTPVYSNDNGSSWTYTPVSGGGGAPAGYDGNVTNWRIPMTGTMNANGANFTISYMVRTR